MKDAFTCLEKDPIPESWAEQIEAMLDEALSPQCLPAGLYSYEPHRSTIQGQFSASRATRPF